MKIINPLAKILAIYAFVFMCGNAAAQTIFCPPNIDFEQGNLNNWHFYSGTCCPINTATPGVVVNRHTLTSGANFDQYGNFPIVAPSGGSFSLKIGNNGTGRQAERARYYIKVPASGSHLLLFRYAVVLQDPTHTAVDQPRFEVKAYDSTTGDTISCSQYTYVASSSLPGFIQSTVNSTVYYKPWTTGTIDLTGHNGKTIAIDFASGDCDLGGHFGYGYVDMNCGLFQLQGTVCDSNINSLKLNAPPGYQSYEWRDGSLTTILGNTQTLSILMPSFPTTFAVILTPYPGFGCIDTIYTSYTTPVYSSVTASTSNDTAVCQNGKINISVNASSAHGPFQYEWSPATGLNCTTCPNPTVTGTTNITYTVIVKNILGCTDTDDINIVIDSVVRSNIMANPDTICQLDTMRIINHSKNSGPGLSQSWIFGGGGIIVSGGGMSDTSRVRWNTTGPKHIIFSAIKGDCISRDTMIAYVEPDVTISLPPDDTICLGDSKIISVTSNSLIPLSYNWVPATYLSCNNCPAPIAKPKGSTLYTVFASNSAGCNDTGMIRITVDTVTFAQFVSLKDSICVYEVLSVKNIGLNGTLTGYLWHVDTGNISYGMGSDSIGVYWKTPGRKKIIHTAFIGPCESSDSTWVTVLQYPKAGFELPPYACAGQQVSLFPLSGAPYYTWNIQEQQITDNAYKELYNLVWNSTGKKTIKLRVNDDYCADSFEKEITIYPFPVAEITKDDFPTICKGDEFQLSATQGDRFTYSWQPALVFNTNNEADVTAKAEKTELYTLQVINQWGCSSYDSVLINVKGCCDIFMPDAFTPNNDGRNDTYWSPDLKKHQLIRFMVANRRGQIVYNTNTPGKGWDGAHNGQDAGQDTYNYYIKYKCGDNQEEMVKKGTVILLR